MCLWNTDAPGGNKVKIWQKSLSPTFWPRPTPGAWDASEVWATLRWTYSPSLFTVWLPKLKILHFVWKWDGITHRQTDRQTDGQTDDPNTRCPRRTFQAGGIKRICPLYPHVCVGGKSCTMAQWIHGSCGPDLHPKDYPKVVCWNPAAP